MSFSENLKNIRAEKNLSQEQLAELLGVSRQAVSKWEQDGGYPETEKLIQIAKKLDVSLDLLLLDKQICDKVTEQLPKNQVVYLTDKRITIQSYDGKTVSAFSKFRIDRMAFAGKDDPKCILIGNDSSNILGGGQVLLGWYATIDDAKRELEEIYNALNNGETTYILKYNANVKVKLFSVKIIK